MISNRKDNTGLEKSVRKDLIKRAFAKRVDDLRAAKGWTQSELSRYSGIPRDAISNYIRGNSLPSEKYLGQLAQALGATAEEILPTNQGQDDLIEALRQQSPLPVREMTIDRSGWARLRVDMKVSPTTAMKIMGILQDETPDGNGSSQAAAH